MTKAQVWGITFGMKVAVSIPDRVYAQAERLAAHLKTSRSALYARALAAFVDRHAEDRITERMNAVLDAVEETRDPFGPAAARRVFDRVEW